MKYSLKPTYGRYVKGYGFLSFARKFGDNCGKKLMDTATKVGTSKYSKKKLIQQKSKEVNLLKQLVKE